MTLDISGKVNYLPAATFSIMDSNAAIINERAEIVKSDKQEVNFPAGLHFYTAGLELAAVKKKVSKMITGMDSMNIDSKAGDKDRLDNTPEDTKATLENYKKYAEAGSSRVVECALKAAGVKEAALVADEYTSVEKPIQIIFNQKASTAEDQIIYAKEGADIKVVEVFSSDDDFDGLFGVRTRVYLEKDAKVSLSVVQVLGGKTAHFHDIGFFENDGAKGELTQLELGGSKVYTGVRTDLAGNRSEYENDEGYLVRNDGLLDMNFVTNHKGSKTRCRMDTKGVLMDKASKVYRGTIDFKEGSSGSVGNETEATLLMSPDCVNRTVPLILCHEEDVEGNHGATIGKIDEKLLFYMESRGISEAVARELMTRARINTVINKLPDDVSKKAAKDYIKEVFGDEA